MTSRINALTIASVFILLALAGCIDAGPTDTPEGSGDNDGESEIPEGGTEPEPAPGPDAASMLPQSWLNPTAMTGASFTPSKIIDDVRAGGEPVIAISNEGTVIVSAHPGYTHVRPRDDSGGEAVTPSQGQSYLWRSEDNGATWTHVSLLGENAPADNSGPRGAGQGVSDPDLTVDRAGRIWLTDLEALAEASISWSDDDGRSWIFGNNVASRGAVDRQWIASYGRTMYFTGNYFSSRPLLATDDGFQFEERGQVPCGGDIVVNPEDGTIYAGCRGGIAFSRDGGATWNQSEANVGPGDAITPEPAIDGAGNVYMVGTAANSTRVNVAYLQAGASNWSVPLELTRFFPDLADGNHTAIWPWVSAGSQGRVAVTFLAARGAQADDALDSEWHAYTVLIINAQGATEAYPVRLTEAPFHVGAVCTGTVCQATTTTDDSSDRRLGDFFETTISPEGQLHIVYSNTNENPSDSISHVAYHRQVAGPDLVEGPMADGLPTQG